MSQTFLTAPLPFYNVYISVLFIVNLNKRQKDLYYYLVDFSQNKYWSLIQLDLSQWKICQKSSVIFIIFLSYFFGLLKVSKLYWGSRSLRDPQGSNILIVFKTCLNFSQLFKSRMLFTRSSFPFRYEFIFYKWRTNMCIFVILFLLGLVVNNMLKHNCFPEYVDWLT